MKKKFSKILGVGLTLALLTSLLLTAAPVSALTQPTVIFPTAADAVISNSSADYSISFVLGTQLAGGSSFRLPDLGDVFTITDHATIADSGTITVTSGSVLATPAGTATVGGAAVPLAITLASGAVAWTTPGNGAGDIVVADTAGLDTTTGTWKQTTGAATIGTTEAAENSTVTATAFSLPDYDEVSTTGDLFTITDHATVADSGTITVTAGSVTATPAGAATVAGGAVAVIITPASGAVAWTAPGAGTGTIVVEANVDGTTGTWTNIAGPVTFPVTEVTEAIVLAAGGDSITITLPVGTVIAAPTGVIAASPGWIGGTWLGATIAAPTIFTFSATARTITHTLSSGDAIGQNATVLIKITNGITNPTTPGAYTLTVNTSKETTAVTSAAYTITGPSILPLPGVVERYNSAGILMSLSYSLQPTIALASAGDVIRVGAGAYDEDLTINKSITLIGDAATTIIKDTNGDTTGGTVTISFQQTSLLAGVVFDGFTVMGDLGGAPALSITGIGVTVQNSVFTKAGTATTAVAQTMVTVNPAVAATTYGNTITNCIFDTTLGATTDTGISVQATNGENTTVSGSTFSVDGLDTAIAIADGTALYPVKVTDCTIGGVSGNGVVVTTAGTVASITDSTLSNLSRALSVTLGNVTVSGSTIDTCGLAQTTTVAAQAAIIVNSTASLNMTSNTISNSPNEIIEVTANSNLVNMIFNNLTGNALGVDNNDIAANTLNATHNWWGVATGPAAGMNVPASTITGMINATAYLGGEVTAGTFTNTVGAASLLTKTTVGVDVIPSAVLTAGDIIGVANYSANPQDATPLPALAGGFYDVYVVDAGAAFASVLIKFYNPNITANTDIYVWGTIAGGWIPVTAAAQGANLYEGFAYATITAATTPSIAALTGTPFALVEAPLAALTAPALQAPLVDDDTVSLTPTFAWEPAPGAAGYYFQLADNAYFVTPLVKLDGDLVRLNVTAYAYVPELDYSTAYYWRVKAVSGTIAAGDLAESAWASRVFTTIAEPVEPTPPIVVEEAPPVVIETPDVIVTLPAETPITPAWIYVIIGVGAVLVIALLVLIVRTRRVA